MDISTDLITLSGIMNDSSYTFTGNLMTDKSEAQQMYLEAALWLVVDDHDTIEDTSKDWQIMPIGVVDPALQDEWKQARLWMMDPMDGALGDDAMPALCAGCNSVFWGDDMVSVATTILRLRDKYDKNGSGLMGNLWTETEPSVIHKLRANRVCKKCQTVAKETRANPWQESVNDYNKIVSIPQQHNLPFNSPNISISPIGSSSGSFSAITSGVDWNDLNYTNGNDLLDCVSKTFVNSDDDDI